MGIVRKLLNNTRRPEGLLGRWMVGGMNRAHAAVADWGMGHLPVAAPAEIAELGCGGGRNAAALLRRYPAARVTALDYSEVSVEKAERVNRREIRRGRCRVVQGDVSRLPFGDGSFELVTAFETVYFWPGPVESFREVYRVLRPGGAFLIVNESDGLGPNDERWLTAIDGLRIYESGQLAAFLGEAGFTGLTVRRNEKKHWLSVLAVREA